MLVAIEGIDTAGKSTQISFLQQYYPDALLTKEPGGTPLGQTIRSLVLNEHDFSPRAEFFLFLADRAEHYHKVIAPHRDKLIISDRSLISGMAYADPSFDLSFVAEANRFAIEGVLPDKVVFLKLGAEELKRRLSLKKNDGIEKRGIEYLLGIQHRIEQSLKTLGISHRIVDASFAPESIFTTIQRFIDG